ncbi:hypothetical protein JCGZ_14210 [Jatropha curcas]|uniref:Cytochrome b5 heme-binding domain-containing protein n=1 Tax=Jatropha curcas TaxID=180498 RepID=A0A067K9E5_JATCU|nr:cytochrome b5 [Jatropha curcas]XP_012083134.1 cytochrome b5 [Jatropha curcas]KDP28439.1 hypothetical protein JCGZ_14210 [Jatropha curcas]
MDITPKIHHFDDVVKHKDRHDCWLLIHGQVFDVTNFLEEHPGGDEVLLAATEKDATDDFQDVGHSKDAKELMKKYYIGDIEPKSVPASGRKYRPPTHLPTKPRYNPLVVRLFQLLLPLLILGAAFALRSAVKKD